MWLKKLWRDFLYKRESARIMEAREAVDSIGEFYLDKHQNTGAGSIYAKAREEILTLGITRIQARGTTVIITLHRPGMLIGRRGENIFALEAYLAKKTHFKKINIVEEKVLTYLIPFEPDISDRDF